MHFKLLSCCCLLVTLVACKKDPDFKADSQNIQFMGQSDEERTLSLNDTVRKNNLPFVAEVVDTFGTPNKRGYELLLFDPVRKDLSAVVKIYRSRRKSETDSILYSGIHQLTPTLSDSTQMVVEFTYYENGLSRFYKSISGTKLRATVVNEPNGICSLWIYSHLTRTMPNADSRKLTGHLRFRLK